MGAAARKRGNAHNGNSARQNQLRADVIADRRATVARLRLQGLSHEQIAAETGWSHQTIRNDLRWLAEQNRRSSGLDYDSWLAEQLGELMAIRHEAWQRAADSRTQERPDGDPRWMAICLAATKQISALMALDDPVKFQGRRTRGEAGTDTAVDIVEVVVSDRDELKEITDQNGSISLAAYKRRLEQSVKGRSA